MFEIGESFYIFLTNFSYEGSSINLEEFESFD